jgi:hypothetical protein
MPCVLGPGNGTVIKVNDQPATPRMSVRFIAHLAEGIGCGGTSSSGYALYDTPRSRADVETDWAAARDAEQDAFAAFEANHPRVVIPKFDQHWEGTRREFRAADAAAREENDEWWSQRAAAGSAAHNRCWASRGARVVNVRSGWLPTCGGEYDEAAHAATGCALYVLHHRGCMCACGDVSYHDEEFDDSETFSAYLTPPVRLVVLDADDPVANVCGTFEFLTFDDVGLTERFAAVIAAATAMSEKRAARRAEVERGVATTDDELDAMTFAEYEAWLKATDPTWPGESYGARSTRRERGVLALRRWDDRTCRYVSGAACDAAAMAALWPVGNRPGRSR